MQVGLKATEKRPKQLFTGIAKGGVSGVNNQHHSFSNWIAGVAVVRVYGVRLTRGLPGRVTDGGGQMAPPPSTSV